MKKKIMFLLITFISVVGCLFVNPAYAEVIQDCINARIKSPPDVSDEALFAIDKAQYETCKSALIKMDQYFPNRDWKTVPYNGVKSQQLKQAYRYVVYIVGNIYTSNIDMGYLKYKNGWDSEGAIKIWKEGKAFLSSYPQFNSFANECYDTRIKGLQK